MINNSSKIVPLPTANPPTGSDPLKDARIDELRSSNLPVEIRPPLKKRWRAEALDKSSEELTPAVSPSTPPPAKKARWREKSVDDLTAIMNDRAVSPDDRAKAKGTLANIIESTSRQTAILYSAEVMNDPTVSDTIRAAARKNLSTFINTRAQIMFDEAMEIRGIYPRLATDLMIKVMTDTGIAQEKRNEAKMQLAAWNPKNEVAIQLYTEVMNDPDASESAQAKAKCHIAILIAKEEPRRASEFLTQVRINPKASTNTKLLADYHFAKLIESTDPKRAITLYEGIKNHPEADKNLLAQSLLKLAIVTRHEDSNRAIQLTLQALRLKGITPDIRAAAKCNLAILITERRPEKAKELFQDILSDPEVRDSIKEFIQGKLRELNEREKKLS